MKLHRINAVIERHGRELTAGFIAESIQRSRNHVCEIRDIGLVDDITEAGFEALFASSASALRCRRLVTADAGPLNRLL